MREDLKKEVIFSPNVLGLAEDLPNNTLLIFTDVAYKSVDGKSSFGYLMMSNNPVFVQALTMSQKPLLLKKWRQRSFFIR